MPTTLFSAERQQRWRALPRLAALLWEVARRDVLLVLLLSIVSGLLPVLSLALLQAMIDSALAMLDGASLGKVGLLAAALFVANALGQAATVAQHWLGDDIHERLRARVGERLLVTSSRLPLASWEAPALYDQLQRAQRGVDGRLLTTLRQLMPIPTALLTLLSLAVYIGLAHPLLPVVLLAGFVPIIFSSTRFFSRRYLLDRRHSPAERRERYWGTLLTERPAAAEVRLFGLRGYVLAAWQQQAGVLRGERVGLARREARMLLGRTLLEHMLLGIALLWVLGAIAVGRLSLGYFASFIGAVSQFVGALYVVLEGIAGTDNDLRYIQDLLGYLEQGQHAAEKQSSAMPPCVARPALRFQSVSFSYPGTDRAALHAIDFVLRPGERVAVVGENGAGKSSLAKLLLGLYEPSSGRITLDGVDLAQADRRWWRRHMAAVFQEYVHYEATARENIGFGDLERLDDYEAIARAARRSGAGETIDALPRGYESMLGTSFDDTGVDLSGGQWQKLAIARAYLRDAPIVVLDEPAAALDARAEAELYRQFGQAAAGRSMLLISHRLGSARLADRIIVLQAGAIVEQGTHAELLRRDGVYAAMYRVQEQWYR